MADDPPIPDPGDDASESTVHLAALRRRLAQLRSDSAEVSRQIEQLARRSGAYPNDMLNPQAGEVGGPLPPNDSAAGERG